VSKKRVYAFHEGNASMKPLLGGKGAHLAEMTSIGLPIPSGFTITTEACREYLASHVLSDALWAEIRSAMDQLEQREQKRFGDPDNPLLVSVRSGAVTSMPGMMDTILNLGLNDRTVEGLARLTGNERFAYDCYRRFIQMFGDVVLHIPHALFEKHLETVKREEGAASDRELSAAGLKRVAAASLKTVKERTGRDFPQDVHAQLAMAVEAVFRSWNNPRAKVYRKEYDIPDDQGTAVNVQAMVFGNRGDDSCTGVLFTRNPNSGEKELYGEYLVNAQGEDVVAGIRTPRPIAEMREEMPSVYEQLTRVAARLEAHFRDMQDIEFTVEAGKLYILQTRAGKRTARAAVKIAVDLMDESSIAPEEAILRIEPRHLDQLLHRSVDPSSAREAIARGLPASPGAASGQVVLDADRAARLAKEGHKVILVAAETTPEDIHGVIAAEGVLTGRGGMTSHAAVVTRGMGKPCVCGCEAVRIDEENGTVRIGDREIREGEQISIDGSSGNVYIGEVKLSEPALTPELERLLAKADEIRTLRVYTNADTPEDARKARRFGAEGIGLCRTEHMFMSPARLPAVQAMILADNDEERRRALAKLLPMQQADFEAIFREMDGLPVTVRLLDPPLHEFLPDEAELLNERRELEGVAGSEADSRRQALDAVIRRVQSMREANPMLGLRGCRLGLMFPDIYDMQAEALFRAAARCIRDGVRVAPEIMIPLVGHPNELKPLRKLIDSIAAQVLGDDLRHCPYRIGTMIEVPRAALVADRIAEEAQFFSFGTNDLTQMTFAYSRDDAEGKFLTRYLDQGVLTFNPFETLDQEGVGALIEMALAKGRRVRTSLKAGICGEHGGDGRTIAFCHRIGLDYVSCSPYRVPYARIAAAQAAIRYGEPGSAAAEQVAAAAQG